MGRLIELFPNSARSLVNLVGKLGALRAEGGLLFGVRVEDIRVAYGRRDLLVSPLSGAGSAWVSAGRVQIADAVIDQHGQEVK